MLFALPLRALLFTLLIGAGANVEVDLGPVPFILSDFFVLLAGLVLGGRWAAVSVATYLLLGLMGLPIFAGGEAGFTYFSGATGGYLVGFLLAAFVVGIISHSGQTSLKRDVVATLSGQAIIFALGVPWLKFYMGFTWEIAISNGFLPFLVPIAIKFVAVMLLARLLRQFPIFKPGWPAKPA